MTSSKEVRLILDPVVLSHNLDVGMLYIMCVYVYEKNKRCKNKINTNLLDII